MFQGNCGHEYKQKWKLDKFSLIFAAEMWAKPAPSKSVF